MNKLLLHCCCAPCSIACVSFLRDEETEFDLFWFNPNIQPEDEYKKRLDCLVEFANNENLNLIQVNSVSLDVKISCELCYRVRLEKTAEYAAQNGYDSFSTTLLISPYQDHNLIYHIGEKIASEYGVHFLYVDFRPLFRKGQKEARTRGFYMQKYCGCGKRELTRMEGGRLPANKNTNYTNDKFDRIKLLTGEDKFNKLQKTKVIIFGLGGVGSWCAEALVRSGIGKITIIDFDKIETSNINRQLQATSKTIGMDKAEILKHRLLEINPDCRVKAHNIIFNKETASSFNIKDADYVIDAIDIITHKLDLIETAHNCGVKLFSSMGMALKFDSLKIKTASIWKTDVCPLSRLVRQGLRKRGFTGDFTVVYSNEEILTQKTQRNTKNGKIINGSIVTVTASAGLLLANLVIQDVLK